MNNTWPPPPPPDKGRGGCRVRITGPHNTCGSGGHLEEECAQPLSWWAGLSLVMLYDLYEEGPLLGEEVL